MKRTKSQAAPPAPRPGKATARRPLAALSAAVALAALAACGSGSSTAARPASTAGNGSSAVGAAASPSTAATDVAAAGGKCAKPPADQLVGPNGEPGVLADTVTVTPEETAAAKTAVAGGTIAISQHFSSDYTSQVVDGIKKAAQDLGASVITSDAGGTPQKQVSDIEGLAAKKPALLVVFPVDAAASAPGLAAAKAANIPVIVVGSALNSSDFVSLISAYDFGGGLAAAKQVIDALGNKGDVAVLPYKFSLWHVNNRVTGFKAGIACSNLKIVADSQTCQKTADCTGAFADILTAHPTIKAAFGAYDGIALGMNAAAQAASWKGFITTSDLGTDTADKIKSGDQPLQGTSAQLTDCQAAATGKAITLALAKKDVAKVIFCNDVPVDKNNVGEVYQRLFGKPLT